MRNFDGREENWGTWAFVARSYLNLLSGDYETYLSMAEQATSGTTMPLSTMTPEAKKHAQTLFHVLVQCAEGKALSILRNVEASNGFQAWKALVECYEPALGGRHTAMLMGIISPSWDKVEEANFLETIEEWEVAIRRYEDQSGDRVTDGTKVAVVMKYAPTSLRSALRSASSSLGTDYNKIKKYVRDFLQAGTTYNAQGESAGQGPAPMDIGAIWDAPKGKGKDTKGKRRQAPAQHPVRGAERAFTI